MALTAIGAKDPKIEKALGSVQWPKYVTAQRYELGSDHNGWPAVWCWIVLRDKGWTPKKALELKDAIRDAVAREQPDIWPYVRFRTVSEEKALAG